MVVSCGVALAGTVGTMFCGAETTEVASAVIRGGAALVVLVTVLGGATGVVDGVMPASGTAARLATLVTCDWTAAPGERVGVLAAIEAAKRLTMLTAPADRDAVLEMDRLGV